MSDPLYFTIPDNDWTELTGSGAAGSIWHQGGDVGVLDARVAFVEGAVKPSFDPDSPIRFKSSAVGMTLDSGKLEQYYGSVKMWAVSVAGDQLITITPGQ